MTDMMQKIWADTRSQVEKAKILRPFEAMHQSALLSAVPRGFERSLRAHYERTSMALIAEIKRSSPASGLIRPFSSAIALAKVFEGNGAACLSIVTNEIYFQGRNEDLLEVRALCSLPLLRKDFIIDIWQVAESRAIGADAISLDMSILDDHDALELYEAGRAYGIDSILQISTMDDLTRALKVPARLIAVNGRHPKTQKIDLWRAAELVRAVPLEKFVIVENGLVTSDDVRRMRDAGARACLIGESLLRQEDVGAALRALVTGL